MEEIYKKANEILSKSVNWLLYSDIRIKNGPNKGALFGWKNLNPVSFPFIYSEITGYAITSFLWIYSQTGNLNALQAAKDAAEWIIKKMQSHMLVARPSASDNFDETQNLYYAFDNGMIMIGLINLHKKTQDPKTLKFAENIGRTIVERFFDGSKLIPRLDYRCQKLNESIESGVIKWSTISGSYHSKLSIGLLELSRLTKNKQYKQVSDSICNYAIKLQKPNGQFVTNSNPDITYLHPHLYACEGLLYSGINQSNEKHYAAGLKGIIWARNQMHTSSSKAGLRANTQINSLEQSDCTAQLLRLLIMCRSKLKESIAVNELDKSINQLHSRLLDFYIPGDEDQGGFRYHLNLDSICSWCSMFSIQALSLWGRANLEYSTWIEYFV